MANNNMIGVLNLYIQKPRNKGYYDIKIIGCLSAMQILITMSEKSIQVPGCISARRLTNEIRFDYLLNCL